MGFKLIGMGHGICFGQCEQFHIILCNPLLPPAKKLGQDNIFRSVFQEFCSPGGLPHCMLGYMPLGPEVAPPGPEAGIPRSRHPKEQTPPTRSRHSRRSACWEIRAISGRYASHWNAILFIGLFDKNQRHTYFGSKFQ